MVFYWGVYIPQYNTMIFIFRDELVSQEPTNNTYILLNILFQDFFINK